MPDPFRNEEITSRTTSLCLFGVPGITTLNRCANCPGASRTAIIHRRCPLDVSEPNIFAAAAAAAEASFSDRSLAGSRKQHEDPALEAKMLACSLDDSLKRSRDSLIAEETGRSGYGRSMSEPCMRSRNMAETFRLHAVDVRGKREAVMYPAESSSRNEQAGAYALTAASHGHAAAPEQLEVDRISTGSREPVEIWIRNKKQKLFEDNPETEIPHLSWAISSLSLEDEGRSLAYSEVRIPGFGMNTGEGLRGMIPCQDGIYNPDDDVVINLMAIDETEVVNQQQN